MELLIEWFLDEDFDLNGWGDLSFWGCCGGYNGFLSLGSSFKWNFRRGCDYGSAIT